MCGRQNRLSPMGMRPKAGQNTPSAQRLYFNRFCGGCQQKIQIFRGSFAKICAAEGLLGASAESLDTKCAPQTVLRRAVALIYRI